MTRSLTGGTGKVWDPLAETIAASAIVGVTGLGLVRRSGPGNSQPETVSWPFYFLFHRIDENTSLVRGRVARWLVRLQPC